MVKLHTVMSLLLQVHIPAECMSNANRQVGLLPSLICVRTPESRLGVSNSVCLFPFLTDLDPRRVCILVPCSW
jgi:hypothetical protein